MANISRVTSSIPSSTIADHEGLSPKKSPKKSPLYSFFGIVRRYPFLSTAFLYAVLSGFVAGIAKLSYNQDKRGPDTKFEHEGDGVSFFRRYWP